MDRTLCRKEAQELMELLGLHMSCWGNVPLIRKKYLMKCKEYHPDKGGDERLMKRLNELYKKLEENVNVVHMENYEEAWNSSQVFHCTGDCCNPNNLVGVIFGEMLDQCILHAWDCVLQPGRDCKCVHCFLERRHKNRYKKYKKPLIWLSCYCFTCYCLWFGKPKDPLSLHYWKVLLSNTRMGEAGL
ncbi:small T antigen [Calomys tener polyomavirus]|uniref:small T antigen n=1 Tax=Akodon montensis polyomavirus TaxID=2163422 RepID=UPI000E29384B|nr:small T antigen [Akodon montensis polyomavirus]AVY05543.1 small T antigen [Akodon montensis polyomavirus]AVY05548.1 small T antigen [Calomys tener polyomavirus]